MFLTLIHSKFCRTSVRISLNQPFILFNFSLCVNNFIYAVRQGPCISPKVLVFQFIAIAINIISWFLITWIEHAAQIKKATALARGKNDKVDSQRIAVYATKNLDRLKAVEARDCYIREDQAPGKLKRKISRYKEEIGNTYKRI